MGKARAAFICQQSAFSASASAFSNQLLAIENWLVEFWDSLWFPRIVRLDFSTPFSFAVENSHVSQNRRDVGHPTFICLVSLVDRRTVDTRCAYTRLITVSIPGIQNERFCLAPDLIPNPKPLPLEREGDSAAD
jgi:hypothetical protein